MAAAKKIIIFCLFLFIISFARGDSASTSISITNFIPNIPLVESTNINLQGVTGNVLWWCNATIVDNNGYIDINNTNATFWNPTYSNEFSLDNVYEHYTNKSCQFENKSATTVYAHCLFNISYKANVGRWICKIYANDTLNSEGDSQINIAVYKCGDNVCTYGEDCHICPSDCGRCSYSGGWGGGSYIQKTTNKTLDKTTAEKNTNAPQPIKKTTSYCGDGICAKNETCKSCQGDCGACPTEKSKLPANPRLTPLQSNLIVITSLLSLFGLVTYRLFKTRGNKK